MGPFQPVAKPLLPTVTSVTDSTVGAGHKYFYRVETRSRQMKPTTLPRIVLAEVINSVSPSPPHGIKISARPGQATVAWDANPEPDIAGYRVYRSLSENGEHAAVSDELVAGLSYMDRIPVTQRNRFWYRVAAVNTSSQEGNPSVPVFVEPPTVALLEPPVLRTGPMVEGKILLEWNRPDDRRIVGYHIHRAAIRNDEMVQLTPTPLPVGQAKYEDADVEQDHPYYYSISVVDAQGRHSALSTIVTASTFSTAAASAPTNLTAALHVPGKALGVTLVWKLPVHSRLRCMVLRSDSPEAGFVRIASPLFESQSTYTDSSVSIGKTYYYRVRATSPAGATSADSTTSRLRYLIQTKPAHRTEGLFTEGHITLHRKALLVDLILLVIIVERRYPHPHRRA